MPLVKSPFFYRIAYWIAYCVLLDLIVLACQGCASSRVLGQAGLVLAWGGTRVVGGGGGLGGLGKLPTVRQAKDRSKASQAQSGKQRTVRQSKDSQASTQSLHRLAPSIRILCTQAFPHTCTQMLYRHAPKIRIHASRSIRIHAPTFDIISKYILWSGTYLEVFLGCLGVHGTP